MLALQKIHQSPALFPTFLMWLLADLFQDLREVGVADKPSLVFSFDEARLLLADASKAPLQSVTQTVRLTHSKGVGVFFFTQTPKVVPEDVFAQPSSRIQDQLRAHTPNDAKAPKSTVQTFPKSDYDLEALLTSLVIGEAGVTVPDPKGAPTRMRAPESQTGPMSDNEIKAAVAASPRHETYSTAIDNESDREILRQRPESGSREQAKEQAGSDKVAFPEDSGRESSSGSGSKTEE